MVVLLISEKKKSVFFRKEYRKLSDKTVVNIKITLAILWKKMYNTIISLKIFKIN